MFKTKTVGIVFLLFLFVYSNAQQTAHSNSNAQIPPVQPSVEPKNNQPSKPSQASPQVVTTQIPTPSIQKPAPIQFQPQQITVDNGIPAIPLSEQVPIHKQQILQISQQNKIRQQLSSELPVWIQQQLRQMESLIQLPITQTFTFIIPSGQQVIFKWDPSKQKQLKIIVDVFYVTREGAISVIKDAEQSQFIQVAIRNPNRVIYNTIGKVYRNKIITVDFDTDYKYLKFTNKNSQKVIVQIDVQKLEYVVLKGVKDDKLSTSQSKMHSILVQTQSTQIKRQHLYKWEWGYFQNQKAHQLRILGLTGIQLFMILLTACVQMYFLKGLLDNRAVV